MLADDVLLVIFEFCADEDSFTKKAIEAWQSLVHVCRRWRILVFGSPRRLQLQLVCTPGTPTRDTLDIWPCLPLSIQCDNAYPTDNDYPTESVENIITGFECSDRVCLVDLRNFPSSHLERVLAAMQVQFPKLTYLVLSSSVESAPVIPDSFLGGSATSLETIGLDGIPFPGVPRLLLSATHLESLRLENIPHSGYMSPEAMVTTLSTLTSLEYLTLGFQSPRSFPDQETRLLPPLARAVLPILASFSFKGVSEYLDDLVARIDAPQVHSLSITFFNQIVFDTPQFIQFIDRTPTLKALKIALLTFRDGAARVNLSPSTFGYGGIDLKIPCSELDWQVSSLEQVCTASLPPLSTLEVLYIFKAPRSQPDWQDNIENALWLDLLRPFPAVRNLYLCEEFAPRIVPALRELVGGRTIEVLPTLQNIFLEELQPSGPVQDGIRQFVAARQVTSHPIAVSRWDNSKRDKFWRNW